jgi:mono/diheme cytochrome c family protein
MNKLGFFFFMLLLLSCGGGKSSKEGTVATTPLEIGEQLFKIKCQQCHMADKDFAAPALVGVNNRWKDQELLYDFVRNSQEVIQRNDYAAKLFETWKQSPMLPYPELTNAEIQAVFDYCNKIAADRKKQALQ